MNKIGISFFQNNFFISLFKSKNCTTRVLKFSRPRFGGKENYKQELEITS